MQYKKTPTAVQLWTLRKEAAANLLGTLQKVREIGFTGVELYFQQWPPAAELKRVLANANLQVPAAHVQLADLRADFARIADYHREIGNKTLVVPIIPEPLMLTEDDWRRIADELLQVADDARAAGFRFAYHHHEFEFQATVGGVEVHDFLFSTVGPHRMQAEIDVFFPALLGRDPAELIRKFAGRVPLVHLKDRASPGSKYRNTELGRGVIDWDAVLTACEAAGVEWYIVEQNCEDQPALDCVRASFEFLREKGVA